MQKIEGIFEFIGSNKNILLENGIECKDTNIYNDNGKEFYTENYKLSHMSIYAVKSLSVVYRGDVIITFDDTMTSKLIMIYRDYKLNEILK